MTHFVIFVKYILWCATSLFPSRNGRKKWLEKSVLQDKFQEGPSVFYFFTILTSKHKAIKSFFIFYQAVENASFLSSCSQTSCPGAGPFLPKSIHEKCCKLEIRLLAAKTFD